MPAFFVPRASDYGRLDIGQAADRLRVPAGSFLRGEGRDEEGLQAADIRSARKAERGDGPAASGGLWPSDRVGHKLNGTVAVLLSHSIRQVPVAAVTVTGFYF